MKLKLTILLALFAAGVFASLALADGGRHGKHADDACHEVHIAGTIAPQTLAVTVDRSSHDLIAAGTQLSLPVGTAGQTVRLRAEACTTGTGTALVLTVKEVELKPMRPKPVTTTGQTTTGVTTTGQTTTTARTTTTGQTTTTTGTTTEKRDDHRGRHHGGDTTTTNATTTTTR